MFGKEKLARREFLRIGSLAVAGVAASGAFNPASLFAAPSSAADALLSVGYATVAPPDGSSVRLGYAADILAGDPEFLRRSARVTLAAYAQGTKFDKNDPAGHEIDAVYPAHGYTPEKYPRFRAWLALAGDTDAAAHGACFSLPVTSDGGAQFVVRSLAKAGASDRADPRQPSLLRLSLGSESGTPKLQRGVYVVAFRESASESAPNWGSYRLESRGGALSIPEAPFTYVVMNVDYGSKD